MQEGLDAIPEVIHHLETYDVTTVRASTPMYLLSRKIKAMGVKMVLSGEGSDEIFGGEFALILEYGRWGIWCGWDERILGLCTFGGVPVVVLQDCVVLACLQMVLARLALNYTAQYSHDSSQPLSYHTASPY